MNFEGLSYAGEYGSKGNVCKERGIFVCQKCDEPLRDEDRLTGEWVQFHQRDKRDDGYISGYWLHQLMRDNIQVSELLSKLDEDKESFYRMFLGMNYNGTDQTVNFEVLRKNLVEPLENRPRSGVIMGLDQGYATGHYYTIGVGKTVFKLGKAKDFNEVKQLIHQYNVEFLVVDSNPNLENVVQLQNEYPNMVYRSIYTSNNSLDVLKFNDENCIAYIARNLQFDKIIQELNEGKYKFAFREKDRDLAEFADHASKVGKVMEEDSKGNMQIKFKAPEGAADHYFHSFLYYTAALERYEQLYGLNHQSFNIDEEAQKNHYFNEEFNSEDWYDL